jgi:phage major head subunit gpT-like protein
MLINDDLGEIAKVMADAGSAAARLENKLVYAQLTSNPTMGDSEQLFSTAHANKGTSAVLTDVTIGEAFKLMREQTSVDGLEKLNIAPEFLICGPQNEVAARKYLATISPNQSSNVNVFSNSLKLIVDSEISTNDYYFASGAIDTVVLYHLDGEESPRIESRTDFETESVELKCAHTCVAKALDWRGLVINEGGS